jgi:hypothetical protein
MTATIKALIPAKQAENAQTTQYTAPAATRTLVDKFTATNTSGAPVTFSVNVVTSGGAAGTGNLIVQAKAIAAGECYTLPEIVGVALGAGDFISTIAGAATSITIRASGRDLLVILEAEQKRAYRSR